MRPIPKGTLDFLRQHEGCVLRVYDDAHPQRILGPGAAIDGALTAGYGHTGPEVRPGLRVTQAMADGWLLEDLRTAATRLERRIGAVIEELTPHQYGAMLSFVFNLGVDGRMAGATIWKRFRARQFDQVPLEMMKFVNAGGRKLQGLVNRRAAEVALWSTAEPGSRPDTPPSSATRSADTSPTPADPVPTARSGTLITALTSATAAALVAVQQTIAVVAPYADRSPLVRNAVATLATVAAGAALAVLVLTWLRKQEARR
ncbi:lysozyme [Phenylobacterium sp.]|jgi:lysozyme|uniref:lysozyme n=1 Tax=Phenylobacterium sp. TaxID=1871053 RepID=UPI002F3F8340